MHPLFPVEKNALLRFLRYALVGGSTLAFDLLLLYVLTTYIGIPYYLATPGAFLVAVSINYLISRKFVFRGTVRSHHVGYTVFISMALIGALVTTTGVALLVTYLHLYFMLARLAVSVIVGMGNYLFNLFFNFNVAGKHE